MKVLLVNGSPHKNGSTNAVLQHMAEEFAREGVTAEVFWLGNQPIAGCNGCRVCDTTNECVIDDVVNTFRAKAKEADGFIFATPVHYAAASGAITSFMDRLFYSEQGGETFRYKAAAAVAVARRGGTTATLDQLNKYFAISEMYQVGSSYWNMVHGANGEEVFRDEEGMRTMRVLARNMVYFLRCQEAGRAAGVALPRQEEPKRTNFIR